MLLKSLLTHTLTSHPSSASLDRNNAFKKILYLLQLFNKLIKADIQNEALLKNVLGYKVQATISDWEWTINLLLNESGINLMADQTGNNDGPTIFIEGNLKSFLTYIISTDIKRAMQTGLKIEGDAVHLQNLQNFLMKLNIDWEIFFALHFEKAFDIFSIIKQWLLPLNHKSSSRVIDHLKTKSETLKMSIEDYIIQEKQLSPVREEVEHYLDAVDLLRSDVERLLARFDTLTVKFDSK